MASKVYKIFSSYNLPPGATGQFQWNNLPAGKAFRIDVQPFYPGSYQEGYDHTVFAEVTRIWRRYRSIEERGSIGVDVTVRQDIFFQVKNVGTKKTHFNAYLIALS